MSEPRFVFRPDHAFGPNIIDRSTGKFMGMELVAEYVAVANAALAHTGQAAPVALENPTMEDAIAAAEGTLHGAIDYWQARARKAEAALAAPAGEVASKPIFWVRLCGDGLYEGPFHHKSAECKLLREEKPSEWHPLYLATPATEPAGDHWKTIGRFLSDVVTAAGLLHHGKQSKALAERMSKDAFSLRHALYANTKPATEPAAPGYVSVPAALEALDNLEEPKWYGYECPNTWGDGKADCIEALRALAAASTVQGKDKP